MFCSIVNILLTFDLYNVTISQTRKLYTINQKFNPKDVLNYETLSVPGEHQLVHYYKVHI